MKKGNLEFKIEYNNKIVIKNIVLYAGDSLNFVVLLNENIADAYFSIIDKKNSVVVNKTYGNGIVDLGNHKYGINVSADDTKNLFDDVYYYKLVIMTNGEYITVLSGAIDVLLTSVMPYSTAPEFITAMDLSSFANRTIISCVFDVVNIRNRAFYNCTSLALTSLPSGVTSIGSYAFYNCTSLTSLTFNGTPQTIGYNAFFGCTNLTDIYVPWSEGEVAGSPWGATNATIHYNS